MFKNTRVAIVRELIEINEKFIFNRRLTKFYKNNTSSINCVIDVGANIGQTIDFFLKLNPTCKIYAFEPNPTLFSKLKNKYKDIPYVFLYPLGISNAEGEKLFYENIYHTTSSFEELNHNSKYLKRKADIFGVETTDIIKDKYIVEITTLAKFIADNIHEPIDVLKIDTEGHEYSCLEGLFQNNNLPDIKYIQLEMHYDDMYKNAKGYDEITTYLKENNYLIDKKIKHGFGDFDEVIYTKQ